MDEMCSSVLLNGRVMVMTSSSSDLMVLVVSIVQM